MQLSALTQRLNAHPDRRICEFRAGRLHEHSFADLEADVRRAVARLERGGVVAGMRVGLLSANRYEWAVYELALLELRCVMVALTKEVVAGSLARAIERFGLHLVLSDAPGEEHCPELASLTGDGPCHAESSRPLERDAEFEVPGWVFSSGSTGSYKCIETDRVGIESLVDSLQSFELTEQDRFLLFLPLSNFQQKFLLYGALWFGIDLLITEPGELLFALRDWAPTLFLAPPIFYEGIAAHVQAAAGIKGLALRAALGLARMAPRWLRAPLQHRVSKPIRDMLGGRIRMMITGMAPIRRDTLELFGLLGLPLLEAYGMTECGIIARNSLGENRPGSVGRLMPGVRLEINDQQEILVCKPRMPTRRYLFGSADESARTYVNATTVATGDLGFLDDAGYLHLRGRKDNVITSSSGAKIQPERVEDELCRCPDLERAVVFGAGAQLSALLVLRQPSPEAESRVRAFIADRNERAAKEEWIARLVFSQGPLPKALMTPNLKLDRKRIAAEYQRSLFESA